MLALTRTGRAGRAGRFGDWASTSTRVRQRLEAGGRRGRPRGGTDELAYTSHAKRPHRDGLEGGPRNRHGTFRRSPAAGRAARAARGDGHDLVEAGAGPDQVRAVLNAATGVPPGRARSQRRTRPVRPARRARSGARGRSARRHRTSRRSRRAAFPGGPCCCSRSQSASCSALSSTRPAVWVFITACLGVLPAGRATWERPPSTWRIARAPPSADCSTPPSATPPSSSSRSWPCRAGLVELVKASITGSILGNLLLILGLALIAGGIEAQRAPVQPDQRRHERGHAGALAVVALVLPGTVPLGPPRGGGARVRAPHVRSGGGDPHRSPTAARCCSRCERTAASSVGSRTRRRRRSGAPGRPLLILAVGHRRRGDRVGAAGPRRHRGHRGARAVHDVPRPDRDPDHRERGRARGRGDAGRGRGRSTSDFRSPSARAPRSRCWWRRCWCSSVSLLGQAMDLVFQPFEVRRAGAGHGGRGHHYAGWRVPLVRRGPASRGLRHGRGGGLLPRLTWRAGPSKLASDKPLREAMGADSADDSLLFAGGVSGPCPGAAVGGDQRVSAAGIQPAGRGRGHRPARAPLSAVRGRERHASIAGSIWSAASSWMRSRRSFR